MDILNEGVARLRRLGFDPVAKLVIGQPAEEIGNFAKQIGADLIVVPAYGLYGAFFVKGITSFFVVLCHFHSFVRPAPRAFFRPDRIFPSSPRSTGFARVAP